MTDTFWSTARRRSGVLLHPTSLPDDQPLIDSGRRFIDWLADCGFGLWQTLPLHPPDEHGSPYSSCSVYAGHMGLLRQDFAAPLPASERAAFEQFVAEQSAWLHEYARYRVLKEMHDGKAWWDWPAPLRSREPEALAALDRANKDRLDAIRIAQFRFHQIWRQLVDHAHSRDIQMVGDLPFLVACDSKEVWCHPDYFQLDAQHLPTRVAGVPPDYFSKTGQRWGNPLYNWQAIAADGFNWWTKRLRHELQWFDVMRLDHFRGFAAIWSIPAESETAEHGEWETVPGQALLEALEKGLGSLPFIAEDLGFITPDVEELRDSYALPGMRILQFGFSGEAANPYLPHNHRQEAVVYTGTHDNDTVCGWYQSLDDHTRGHVDEYLGRSSEQMPWPMVRAALASVALWSVLPLQDVLGLDGAHRMNIPGSLDGNWRWRFAWSQLDAVPTSRLRALNALYGRC